MNDHGHQGHAHSIRAQDQGESVSGAQLIVETDPSGPMPGQPANLRLMIHAADGTMVSHFDTVHEEKVHLVIVSEGLDHFAHLHPHVDSSGNLTVTHTFPAGGDYRLFADYTPSGGEHETAAGLLSLGGASPPEQILAPNAPGEIEADGLRATVSVVSPVAGSPVRVSFSLRDENGTPPTLEAYMGEAGHLMFVGVRSWRYVHVHPVGAVSTQGTVEFEAHFPTPGLYKGWGQFKVNGGVRVVPLVVKVE